MNPIIVPDSMPAKVIIAIVCVVALYFALRSFGRNGRF
jgi:hypothetical protein